MWCSIRPFILIAVAALAACAITPEPRRVSEGSPVPLSSVRLAEPREGELAWLAVARQAVAAAITRKGMTVSAQSPLEMDVALSSRPPSVALFAKSGALAGIASVAGKDRPARLDLCKDAIVRISVSLVDLKTGQQLYRAHAEDQTCRKLGDPLIKSLANQAMAELKLTY